MNSLQSYIDYFEMIARELNSIKHRDDDKHFISITPEQLFESLRSQISERLLMVENYSINYSDLDGAIYLKVTGAFSILKYLGDKADYTTTISTQDWAEIEVRKVLARIKKDKEEGIFFSKMSIFSLSDVEQLPLANTPLGWYGNRAQFSLTIPSKICYDTADWTPYCEGIGNGAIGSSFIIGCDAQFALPNMEIGNTFIIN